MSLVLAVLSSVVLGGADFVGGLAAKRLRSVVVVIWSNAAGLAVALVGVTLLLPGQPSATDLGWGLLAGLCSSFGTVLLYRALAAGVMVLAAPVAAVSAALLPVAIGLGTGERLSVLSMIGVVVAAVALALISRRPAEGTHRTAPVLVIIALAVGAGLGFGAFMVCLSNTPTTSGLWPLVVARLASLALLVAVAAARRVPMRATASQLGACWLAGALDMASSVLYLLAVRDGSLAVVGLLASLAPVSTVLLARVLLKERTHVWQRIGAGLAMSSVLMLAVT